MISSIAQSAWSQPDGARCISCVCHNCAHQAVFFDAVRRDQLIANGKYAKKAPQPRRCRPTNPGNTHRLVLLHFRDQSTQRQHALARPLLGVYTTGAHHFRQQQTHRHHPSCAATKASMPPPQPCPPCATRRRPYVAPRVRCSRLLFHVHTPYSGNQRHHNRHRRWRQKAVGRALHRPHRPLDGEV